MHKNAISSVKFFFWGWAIAPSPHPTPNPLDHSKLSGSALTFPQNDNQIYATVASP